jgi:hypothetical protein
MSDEELYDQALKLSNKIQECLEREIRAERFSKTVVPCVRLEVEFSYDTSEIGERTTSNFDKTHLRLTRPAVIQSFEQLPEYKRLTETAESIVGDEYAVKFAFIPNIVDAILRGIENQKPYDENIKKSINIWIGDILAHALHWNLSVWTRGVRIKADIGEEIVELGHGLSIRRPNSSEFGYVLPDDEQTRFAPNIDDMLDNVPDAILELSLETSRGTGACAEVKNRIDTLLTCLRLFRLGSIYAIKVQADPESFTQPRPIPRLAPFRRVSPHTYDIGQDDLNRLRRFIDQTEKWLSTARTRKNTSSEAEIAIERYRDALLAEESATYIEHSIASAVMCLEALYSLQTDELKYRMSLRTSAILRHFAFDPQIVYKIMGCAYDIRSIFAHGQLLSEAKKAKFNRCGSAQEIADNVLEYARILILTYLAVIYSTKVWKKGFIDRIDRSIVDAKGDETISNAAMIISAMTIIH